ncbi:MAG: RNA polymerase sigma factor [Acidimicrobiales bacterium]
MQSRVFRKEAVIRLAELEAQIALERIFADHYEAVFAYAVRRTSQRVEAEEVVSETMVIAWQRLEVLRTHDNPRMWLYATARGVLAHHRRAASRRTALSDKLVEHQCESGDIAEMIIDLDDDEALAPILQAFEMLRESDKELIRLVVFEHLSHAEIAEVLDCGEAQVRSRLYRARIRVRRVYEDHCDDLSEKSDGTRS